MPIIAELVPPGASEEVILSFGEVMSSIFCDVIVTLDLDPSTSKNTYICRDYVRLVHYYPRLYKLCAYIVNSLARFVGGVLSCKMLLQYLTSFVYLFPEYKYVIHRLLNDVLKNINVSKVLEQHAKFLLQILLKDESISRAYREELLEKPNVRELLNEPTKPLPEETKGTPLEAAKKPRRDLELSPKCGYAIKVEIPAGKSYKRILEVDKGNSVLFCGFSIEAERVSYRIRRMDEEWKECEDRKVCEAGKAPVKCWVVVKDPGLYMVEWSNEDAWVGSRVIKYRIVVFEPL